MSPEMSLPDSRPKILVVDDSPTGIELLVHFLRSEYRVSVASCGPSALELVEGPDKPDLILLDIMMPGMDGFEVCRRLKQNAVTRDIPVIFITALDSVSDQVQGFEAGAVDYLNKPLLLDGVRARIALHLRLHQQQRELDQYRLTLEERVAERTRELEATSRHLGETLFAMDRVGIAIHWVDAESGRFLYVNEATCEMTGYGKAELLAMTVADLDPNVPGKDFAEYARVLIDKPGPSRMESINIRKDGLAIPVEVIIHYRAPQTDVAGHFITFVLDIAERRKAELAAEQARQLLQEAVDSLSKGFVVHDRDDRLVICNEAYRRLYALTSDLIAPGSLFEDTVRAGAERGQYPDALGNVDAWVSERMASHRRADGVPIEQRLADGSWLQIVENRTGSGYVVGSRTDISSLKRVTGELEEHRRELESLVRQRTEQLRHLAMEATLAEERERQAIARDLHDDLGQMLHVVRIKLDSLMPAVMPDAQGALRNLTSLVAEASRMVRSLISQLSPPILAELGLVPALAWLAEEMETNYALAVEIECEEAPKPLASAKETILFRVVRELLINVAKHAGTNQARVSVRSREGHLELMVEDEGIGIANAEKVMMGREGFGLSSVRERIAYLGGTMEIQTAPKGGTAVILKMPLE